MELLLTCFYCNNKWQSYAYSGSQIEFKCSKCGDTNIIVKELSKTKIDTYVGCPSFKSEENKFDTEPLLWSSGD